MFSILAHRHPALCSKTVSLGIFRPTLTPPALSARVTWDIFLEDRRHYIYERFNTTKTRGFIDGHFSAGDDCLFCRWLFSWPLDVRWRRGVRQCRMGDLFRRVGSQWAFSDPDILMWRNRRVLFVPANPEATQIESMTGAFYRPPRRARFASAVSA